MELKYITTTTTVSPYVTFFNDMKTSLEYEHFILIILFIHLVLASLILRKVQQTNGNISNYINVHISNGLKTV